VPSETLIDTFDLVLGKSQGKNVFYVARNLLRLVVDGAAKELLMDAFAYDYFRLFTLVV